MPGPEHQRRRPPQNPNDGKGADRYSKKVASATDHMEKHPDPANPISIIANYARLGESLRAAGNFRKVAMEIARIAELAETTAMEETADWFDGHTVKRNMAELKKYAGAFSKLAEELDMQQQRASALYDDMGNVLGRYFDMAELEPITSAINPEDRAPEFDGPGGNPVDDKARKDWDARDGVDDDISPEDRAPEFDGPGGNPTDDSGRKAWDARDGVDDSEDDVVEGLVNRIMEKLIPENDQEDYEDYLKRATQKRKAGMAKGGRGESALPATADQARKAIRTPKSFARPHQGFTHDQAKEILRRTGATTTEDAQKTMDAASRIREGGPGSGKRRGGPKLQEPWNDPAEPVKNRSKMPRKSRSKSWHPYDRQVRSTKGKRAPKLKQFGESV